MSRHVIQAPLVTSVLVQGLELKGKVHPFTDTEFLYRPYGHGGSRVIALLFLDHGNRRW